MAELQSNAQSDDDRMPAIPFDRVADLYDEYVRVDFDIPFWTQEGASIGGRVLELACGTGRVSLPLLRAGVDLTCVDYSPGMLAVFRRKLEEHHLSCELVCQDMAELDLPGRFDLILIPFHAFSEVYDQKRQEAALQRVHAHLKEDGIFILSLQNPAVKSAACDGCWRAVGRFPLPSGDTLAVRSRTTCDPATGMVDGTQEYEKVSARGAVVERRSLPVRFRLMSRVQVEELAGGCGFFVDALYGDYGKSPFDEGASEFMIWRFRKHAPDRTLR
jgi:SAM-dependent methyltransferase